MRLPSVAIATLVQLACADGGQGPAAPADAGFQDVMDDSAQPSGSVDGTTGGSGRTDHVPVPHPSSGSMSSGGTIPGTAEPEANVDHAMPDDDVSPGSADTTTDSHSDDTNTATPAPGGLLERDETSAASDSSPELTLVDAGSGIDGPSGMVTDEQPASLGEPVASDDSDDDDDEASADDGAGPLIDDAVQDDGASVSDGAEPTAATATDPDLTTDTGADEGETDAAPGGTVNQTATDTATDTDEDSETVETDDPTPVDAGTEPAGGSDASTGQDAHGSPDASAPELAVNGPETLAPGGIGLLQLAPEELAQLGSITFGGIPLSIDDGERVQFVLAQPELDNTPASEGASSVDLGSLGVMLPLNRTALGSLPADAAGLLRVAVRAPTTLAAGTQEVVLTTASGDVYTWPVEIVSDAIPYVLPTPSGIIWPAVSNHEGVFPIGTSGPYYPLVDPIFVPSYPMPYPVGDVSYDFRLSTFEGEMCAPAAPTAGLVSGAEIIAGVGESPIQGFYDLENGNFIEVTIDRSAIGGTPELYRGGWVTGTLSALQHPPTRGQLPPPAPGHAFVTLRSLRTGLPLVFNYRAVATALADACPGLGGADDAGAAQP